MTTSRPTLDELATQYHRTLPERLRRYLHVRGIFHYVIDRYRLGWNGYRITIPIRDRDGKVAFFKLAKDPASSGDASKMMASAGSRSELYGWEHLKAVPQRIIVCEGEFDRLVLEGRGFAAVTSTGGAGVFRQEWADALKNIPEVYVCYDRDAAGREGALKVARMMPPARIVELPEEVGEGGDVTDYFIRLKRSPDDFRALLRVAQLPPPEVTKVVPNASARRSPDDEIADLKRRIAIEQVVERFVKLHPTGPSFTGRCLFHDDRTPSLVVYPETQSFYCFGCRAHGDVIEFLMRAEEIGFREALDALHWLADPHA